MSNNNDSSGAIGCVAILLLIVLVPMLIELIKILIPLAAIGAAIYGFLHLKNYDAKTGNITKAFEKTFKVDQQSNNVLELRQNDEVHPGLPAGTEDRIISHITNLGNELTVLRSENEEIKANRKKDIHEALEIFSEEIKSDSKKELLEQIYGPTLDLEGYQRSDEYEKKEFLEHYKKKKEELDFRELKQDLSEKILNQDHKILEFRDEAKEDRYKIREEMTEGFTKLKEKLLLVEKDLLAFKIYVSEKFSSFELAFFKELESLKGMITGVHYELKQEISDTKFLFGQEILRIDKQQSGLIDKIRAYEHRINSFSVELRKVKVDAERFAMRGENMLDKAQVVYQRHKTDLQKASNELGLALDKIALKEEGFANTVGAARIKMDFIANQQYLALKDIAHEKIGVEMLRQSHGNREALEFEKMGRLNDQKRSLLQQIKSENAHSKSLTQLNHRLNMTEENLNYSKSRYNILQQESATFNKLSK